MDKRKGRWFIFCFCLLVLLFPKDSHSQPLYDKGKTIPLSLQDESHYQENFAVFPFLDWIAALTVHIPNKGN